MITKVFLAIPSHRGNINIKANLGLEQLLSNCKENGFDIEKSYSMSASIDQTRSMYASQCLLRNEHDILFFLDDDIVFNPSDFYHVVNTCLSKKSIVGGLYPQRSPDSTGRFTLPLHPLYKGQSITFGNDAEPIEVAGLPCGFLAVHIDAFKKLSEVMPKCKLSTDSGDIIGHPFFIPELFAREPSEIPMYLPEDLAFCYRARDAGINVWLDPAVRLIHLTQYAASFDDVRRTQSQQEK